MHIQMFLFRHKNHIHRLYYVNLFFFLYILIVIILHSCLSSMLYISKILSVGYAGIKRVLGYLGWRVRWWFIVRLGWKVADGWIGFDPSIFMIFFIFYLFEIIFYFLFIISIKQKNQIITCPFKISRLLIL